MPDQRRPYRSHKVPACDRCRRFKRRCTGGTPDQPCVLCNLQDVPCLISASPKTRGGTRRSAKPNQERAQPRTVPSPVVDVHHAALSPVEGEVALDHIGTNYHGSAGEDQSKSKVELSMVASPVISEDIQILERYMSSKASSMPSVAGTPMVYMKVRGWSEGLAISENPGKRQKETLRQILNPYADELIRLYFEEIHPAFPILDSQSFLELYRSGDKLSPALTCEFFALSLILWQHSPSLRQFPKPDSHFIWNLAVEALQQDFLAPGLSTVFAVVLDMMGRPVYSVLANTINNGRAVALAQSLGLNRDPTKWKRPASEKSLRIRLWWAVVIHDRWSSFSHGIPPIIAKGQYDVPVPLPRDILPDANQSEKHARGADCFIHLCTLTNILGEVLPLTYHLDVDQKLIWKQIRRLELDLCEWEDSLPAHLRPGSGDQTRTSGSSSLRLGYLSVRLLLHRISLHVATLSDEIDRSESTRYHLAQLRRSAQDVVEYVCFLTKSQLQEFWLPYTAHHLILTVIILLRCTVESTEKIVVESCKSGLRRLWTKLQNAAEDDGWDLGNICITQCAESVSKILGTSAELCRTQKEQRLEADVFERTEPANSPARAPRGTGNGMATELVPDILPFANPDISFDNQWDMGLWYGLGWMDMDSLSYEGVNPEIFQI
ncbi:hypothetical protein EYZ11_012042 [Aspergillus tanneri]|uniref:Zn(2)-C6 fungal-type domain-containing protein n=1 Tax=Aspergillus tanneri TaxID=1220188 RepID=A0A4S3J3D1_9EURO|nr:hypothetical protein EYZ11_012042 [Aspergillus tanneri]